MVSEVLYSNRLFLSASKDYSDAWELFDLTSILVKRFCKSSGTKLRQMSKFDSLVWKLWVINLKF